MTSLKIFTQITSANANDQRKATIKAIEIVGQCGYHAHYSVPSIQLPPIKTLEFFQNRRFLSSNGVTALAPRLIYYR